MANMERFTGWLSKPERQALRDEAARLHSSENYVFRTLVREGLMQGGLKKSTEKPERV